MVHVRNTVYIIISNGRINGFLAKKNCNKIFLIHLTCFYFNVFHFIFYFLFFYLNSIISVWCQTFGAHCIHSLDFGVTYEPGMLSADVFLWWLWTGLIPSLGVCSQSSPKCPALCEMRAIINVMKGVVRRQCFRSRSNITLEQRADVMKPQRHIPWTCSFLHKWNRFLIRIIFVIVQNSFHVSSEVVYSLCHRGEKTSLLILLLQNHL